MFLTAEQLQDLTGYRLAAYQVKWLRKSGIRHYVRADGKPRVPVSAVDEGKSAPKQVVQPDFAALKRVN